MFLPVFTTGAHEPTSGVRLPAFDSGAYEPTSGVRMPAFDTGDYEPTSGIRLPIFLAGEGELGHESFATFDLPLFTLAAQGPWYTTFDTPLITLAAGGPSAARFDLLLLTLDGVGGPAPSAIFNLPVLNVNASGDEGNPPGEAEFSLFSFGLDAAGFSGNAYTFQQDLPLITLESHGAGKAEFTFGALELDASGESGHVGVLATDLPLLTLNAVGSGALIINGAFNLPLLSMNAAGYTSPVWTASFSLFTPRLEALGVDGGVGVAEFDLPLIEFSGTGYDAGTGEAIFTLPMIFVSAIGDETLAEIYRTWVMNTRTRSLVEYDNYKFNSVVKFAGRQIAAGPQGLTVIGGTNDNGIQISSVLRTGMNDFDSSYMKRVPRIYATVKTAGSMLFTTITSEDGRRTYRLQANGVMAQAAQQRRVPVGRGPKSARWAFEIANEEGADFSVQNILAYPTELRRRVS